MPSKFLNDSGHWRFRAEEMRVAAEAMNDESCRQTAMRLAEDYERLADRAEERLRLEASLREA